MGEAELKRPRQMERGVRRAVGPPSAPFRAQAGLHQWYLDMPISKINTNTPYNGGMFGGWNWVDYSMIPTYVSAIIAKRTGRPVKWVLTGGTISPSVPWTPCRRSTRWA